MFLTTEQSSLMVLLKVMKISNNLIYTVVDASAGLPFSKLDGAIYCILKDNCYFK